MRVAVVSDIHANLPALEAVLAAIDEEAPDELWCLGDVVGYGPNPNECVAVVRERADVCLSGNHDLAVLGALPIEDFSPDAATSARWSASVLDDDSRSFLALLPSLAPRYRAQLFHASARDPVWEYVLTEEAASASLALTDAPVVLVGHSHVALSVTEERGGVTGGAAPEGTEVPLEGRRWLLNPGSVGQPRDRDPRAAWLLIDFDAGWAAFRRVRYPIDRTQEAIRARGLPPTLASRLALGE
ncbi:MAG TPA: metallophosphoesterase family protein [Gaiellaceae bacterium]|nr:metallophosphoesterase family protein [Gaiellaceae bacterium]